jgi:hypothetical protein
MATAVRCPAMFLTPRDALNGLSPKNSTMPFYTSSLSDEAQKRLQPTLHLLRDEHAKPH